MEWRVAYHVSSNTGMGRNTAEHTKQIIFGLPYEVHASVRGEGFGFMMRTETLAPSDTEKCEGAVTRNKAVH